jgi:hypothetical protein
VIITAKSAARLTPLRVQGYAVSYP